jgi:hypothetical protein
MIRMGTPSIYGCEWMGEWRSHDANGHLNQAAVCA